MDFKNKITDFRNSKGLSLQDLAKELDLTYDVMNRNIRNNKITTEFMFAIARRYPEVDLNWLFKEDFITGVSEPGEIYESKDPKMMISHIRSMLDKLEEGLSQK